MPLRPAANRSGPRSGTISITIWTTAPVILRTIGHDNPLAATQFGLLTAATFLPLTYMQMADGAAYHLWGGVNGSYIIDASVSGACCLTAPGEWQKKRPAV